MAMRCFCPPDKLVDSLVAGPREPDALQHAAHTPLDFRSWDSPPPQTVGDVLGHRHHGEEGQVLEDEIDRAAVGRNPRHGAPADQDVPGVRLQEAGDHAQECGLAAPRGAEDREEGALGDLEGDALHGSEAVEAPDHVARFQVNGRSHGWASRVVGDQDRRAARRSWFIRSCYLDGAARSLSRTFPSISSKPAGTAGYHLMLSTSLGGKLAW